LSETRDIPLSEKVFFAWLEDLGWKPKLSAPGLLAKQIYKKLDGRTGLLTNEKLLGLLEHMNGGLVEQDGSPVAENKIVQERELPVGEVINRLAGTSRRGSPLDYLLEKEIFKVGLRLRCPKCLRNSWFLLKMCAIPLRVHGVSVPFKQLAMLKAGLLGAIRQSDLLVCQIMPKVPMQFC
jgi:hypothetical protein